MPTEKNIQTVFLLIIVVSFLLLVFITAGCNLRAEKIPLPTPLEHIQVYTQTPTPILVSTSTPTATVNPLVTLTPTPDPFLDLYIDSLKTRKYGGGVLEDAGNLNDAGAFTRKLFKYRSEGLNLYGFINIPEGEGPFPVIILLHGYVDPAEYNTLDYSARYADALAEAGYIAVHPNLRGYAPSEDGDNVLGIGDTIDILNLIALIRQQSGVDGLLKKGDGKRIGLWGHSMGGGILMRVLIVDRSIKGGLLYAAVNTNEEFNLAHFEKDGRGNEKLNASAGALALISPSNYLNEISSPLSIHHGGLDHVIPIEWSRELCETLSELGKEVECREYPDQPHTFQNSGDAEFIGNMIAFFDKNVK